jgi:hypothetical protein
MEKFWLEYELRDVKRTLKILEMNVDFINSDNGKFIDEEKNTSHENKIRSRINSITVSGNLFTGVDIQVNDKIMLELYKLNINILKEKMKNLENRINNLEK